MIVDLATQAYNALHHNRRRSVLTMLGMAWGIATVVLLLAYGTGFERGLWSAFRSFGTNLVFIFPGRTELQAGGTKAGTQVRLTVNDLDSIRAEVPLLKRVSPEAFKNCVVAFGTRSSNYGVSGVYASYGRMRKMEVAEGTFFSEADDYTHTRVAVIGSDAKKKLFSGQNALGENVRLDGISYQIVGVLKHQVQNGDDNINEHVYVPFSAMSDLTNTYYLSSVVMEYEGDHAKVVKAVRDSMAFHHSFNPKDQRAIFVFDVFADLMDLQVISTGIKILLGFIGLLTLGIGGVGLMNIMLVSVTQRTREIGVEKALGAHRWHILFQFLAEALVITALGGLLGVVLAYLVSWSVGSLTLWSAFEENASEGDIHLYIDSATLIWSTVILSFVGIISGMLPAIKAARLNPIEALRYSVDRQGGYRVRSVHVPVPPLVHDCLGNRLRRDGPPIQEDIWQDGSQRNHGPDDGFNSDDTHPHYGRQRNDHPRHGKDHGKGIAADHPATVLRDVAVAHTVECDCGGHHPSERLHARGRNQGRTESDRHGNGQRCGNKYAHHIHVSQRPVSLQVSRTQAVGELEHSQQHGKDAEKRVRHEVPSHWREVLRDLGSGIENTRVLHVHDKDGQQTEDHEEHKLGLRAPRRARRQWPLIFPQV